MSATQLRAAQEGFARLGAHPWRVRVENELCTCGVTGPPRRPGGIVRLTPQELQVVRLAADGLTNAEIAVQMFLSPRTVARQFYKAYPKLGTASRADLPDQPLDGTGE